MDDLSADLSLRQLEYLAAVVELGSVSRAQNEATRLQREVQLDNPSVSLEETMVSMQKASLSFQAMTEVRNRLVEAYQQVMNMPI